MKKYTSSIIAAAIAVGGIFATTSSADAGDFGTVQGRSNFSARLNGYQEIPSISTTGIGDFRAEIKKDQRITYRLTFRGLEGTASMAHIHFGGRYENGGVSAFLCSNMPGAPVGTQACPASGTITGTITPANVVGPAGQGIAPGEYNELVSAIRAGDTYVNVHSSLYPAGEIRGQIR